MTISIDEQARLGDRHAGGFTTSDGRRLTEPSSAEKIFVVIVLLLSLGAFQNFLVTGRIETQNMGMPAMQMVWLLVYLIALALYGRFCINPWRRVFALSPIVAVLLLAVISALWSQDYALTIRRSVALGLTVIFGTYFASRFSAKEQFQFLARSFGVCIVFSFLFELIGANPDMGSPGWYGVFYLKTQLGAIMALSTVVFLFWRKLETTKKHVATLGLIASLALVFLSRDVTSIITVFAILLLLFCLPWVFRGTTLYALATISTFLCLGTLLLFYIGSHLQRVTALVGKDPMLTGRVPLWILATAMAVQRPWFGYGFDAFWLPGTIYVHRMWQILRWMPPHAHNGLLELWLELGLVGVGLFLVGFGYYLLRAVRHLRSNHSPVAAWPLVFLLFLFLSNLTESHFLNSNSVYFILYVAVAATLVENRRATQVSSLPRVEP